LRTIYRAILPALLLLVLALRTFAPPGYMIGEGAGGSTALVLCPGVHSAAAAEHRGHHGKGDPARPGETPCPFAAMGAAALPPAPPVFHAAAPAPPSLPLLALRTETRRPSAAAPPPPSTGPPARA
jgi:hypothetical protein